MIFAKVLFVEPSLFIKVCCDVDCDWAYVGLPPDHHVLEVTVHTSTDNAMLLLRMEWLSPVPGCGWFCCVVDVGSLLFFLFST